MVEPPNWKICYARQNGFIFPKDPGGEIPKIFELPPVLNRIISAASLWNGKDWSWSTHKTSKDDALIHVLSAIPISAVSTTPTKSEHPASTLWFEIFGIPNRLVIREMQQIAWVKHSQQTSAQLPSTYEQRMWKKGCLPKLMYSHRSAASPKAQHWSWESTSQLSKCLRHSTPINLIELPEVTISIECSCHFEGSKFGDILPTKCLTSWKWQMREKVR